MKKTVLTFFRRGITACGIGPLVLAIIYMLLKRYAGIETLTVEQACTGIFSLTALAFVAGGINVVYQVERLPLMVAVLIHGVVLYAGYLTAYLLNDWLSWGAAPVLVFTGVFFVGYFAIWAVIYFVMKKRTAKINAILKNRNQSLNKL